MTETFCKYSKDRDELLVAYLYDEPIADDSADRHGLSERARFAAHLATCARCRAELSALTDVRTELARWSPPELSPDARAEFLVAASESALHTQSENHSQPERISGVASEPALQSNLESAPRHGRTIPVWAQIAAAMVFMGIGAGLANLDVHYDRTGLTVRTGWSRVVSTTPGGTSPTRVAPPAVSSADSVHAVAPASSDAWRAEMAALEKSLRNELQKGLQAGLQGSSQTSFQSGAQAGLRTGGSAARVTAAPAEAQAEVLSQVRALLAESEKRQERELALRVADVMRDLDTQRRADLVKIDRSLGLIQNNAGVEVLKQRELLNYLVRASQNK